MYGTEKKSVSTEVGNEEPFIVPLRVSLQDRYEQDRYEWMRQDAEAVVDRNRFDD